jgi:hypothetical protein
MLSRPKITQRSNGSGGWCRRGVAAFGKKSRLVWVWRGGVRFLKMGAASSARQEKGPEVILIRCFVEIVSVPNA